jgi:hypothetical protein
MICHKISAYRKPGAEIVADLTNMRCSRWTQPVAAMLYKVFMEHCGLTVPHHAADLLTAHMTLDRG